MHCPASDAYRKMQTTSLFLGMIAFVITFTGNVHAFNLWYENFPVR